MNPQFYCVLSGFLGIIPFYTWFYKNIIISLLILSSTWFTVLQHMCETLGSYEPYLQYNPTFYLFLDRCSAVLLAIVMLYTLRHNILESKYILIVSFALLFVCDCGLITYEYYYAYTHSLWHICIWYYLYLRSELYILKN